MQIIRDTDYLLLFTGERDQSFSPEQRHIFIFLKADTASD
jgi:hypothetical protein